MNLFSKLEKDAIELNDLNERVPEILAKLRQFYRVKIELFLKARNILAQPRHELGNNPAENYLKRIIRVMKMEINFNLKLCECVSSIKKTQKHINRGLLEIDDSDIKNFWKMLFLMLEYLESNFAQTRKNLKDQVTISKRLLKQRKYKYKLMPVPYNQNKDLQEFANIFEETKQNLDVIQQSYEVRNLHRLETLMRKFRNMRMTKLATRAVSAIILVSIPAGTLLVILIEKFVLPRIKIFDEFRRELLEFTSRT